ncbi:hypothetical protein V8B55DRAFT_1575035 [Mucor lusitanicus]|uniref:Uncharacterized protein n=2 Tax=Mucor circinelloides f. lusitanicus TaxID=29924 RepID=A0A168GHP7_MUCCL|nr:hypothetical protein FB192DRAFT_1444818 [Mucor lusitanicus]OAC97697.1 hypothetical protein MUCCIDRAFT_116184 [Mucor lusitanicus CBS 277.49]
MASTHETRNRDNEKFKLGQFDAFEEAYMRAIDILFLQVITKNVWKIVILHWGYMVKRSGNGSTTIVVIQWRDQIIK